VGGCSLLPGCKTAAQFRCTGRPMWPFSGAVTSRLACSHTVSTIRDLDFVGQTYGNAGILYVFWFRQLYRVLLCVTGILRREM